MKVGRVFAVVLVAATSAAIVSGAMRLGAVAPGTTERVSVDSAGAQPNGYSNYPSISADGRYVAFDSNASNLVPGDTNATYDAFLHDRVTGATERVSVDSAGAQGNGDSLVPSISADGRYVAFRSSASNLVAGDTNGTIDVFVHDRVTGTTERVSVDSAGAQGNSDSFAPSISADGRYVAFHSFASNLVPGDTNATYDVFVHDRVTGATERVSVDSAGVQGNAASGYNYVPSITADGRYVAFWSYASNLVPGDTNAAFDVFVHDRVTGTTERVSVDSAGAQGNGYSWLQSISADGRYVAFQSSASNLVPGDTNLTDDVFVHDRVTGTTERVSVDSAGTQGNGPGEGPSISAAGRYAVFQSLATNLVAGDTNGTMDVFVHDRVTGTTERVSVDSAGAQGNSSSEYPSISADGRYVAFPSSASNLVPGDTNGATDVFVRDRCPDGSCVLSPARPANVLGASTSVGADQSKEPITLATGNYTNQHTDVAIAGKGYPLAFARSYNAQDTTAGRLGVGWQDNLNARLLFDNVDHSIANVTAVQEDGRQDDYARQSDGSYVTPPSVFDQLTRNTIDGSFTLRRKDRSKLHFAANGVLQSMENRNGNLTTLTYSGGNLTTVTDPSGRTLTFAYDLSNRITSVTDPLSRVTTYAYDVGNNLASATDPAGQRTAYTYDASHRMLTITDPRGNVIMTNVFDVSGRVTSQTNADSKTWSFTYGAGQTTETDPRGCATVHAYDVRYRSTSVTDCLGGITTYAYDGYGSRNSVTDPLARTTNMTFDARGNLLSVTDPASNTTSMTYDAQDDLLSKTDALGRTSSFTYDANGNVLTTRDAMSGVTSLSYDAQGEVLMLTDPLAHASSFSYNANGYQTSKTDALSHTTGATYDAGGRRLSQTDALGNTTTFTYDAVDRLLTVTDPLFHITAYVYDANGNRTAATDANIKTTSYAYDVVDRLATVTDAAGGVVTYAYDAVGNRTSMTDANTHTTSYQYDPLNRLTRTADPLGNNTDYFYDAAGERTARIDAMGRRTNYVYDALGRLKTTCYPNNNASTGCVSVIVDQRGVGYVYDALGNRLSMSGALGANAYQYDVLNRLTQVTYPGSKSVGYAYDAAGRRTALTYPDGKVLTYGYDAANRLTSVTDWAARTTLYGYDAGNRPATTTRSNGVVSTDSFDVASRLTAIAQPGGNIGYTLDNVGNRQTKSTGASTESYSYDNLYRLTAVQYAEGDCQAYSYDPMGNRTSLVSTPKVTTTCDGAPVTTGYNYDAADRLTLAGATGYAFNANGDQTQEGQRSFQYEREDRLTRVGDWIGTPQTSCPSINGDNTINSIDLGIAAQKFGKVPGDGSWSPAVDINLDGVVNAADLGLIAQSFNKRCTLRDANAYDGDGLRQYRAEPTGVNGMAHTTRFYWDIAAPIPVIIQDSDGNSYEYGQSLILQEAASTPTWYLQDGLGSTTAMTDGTATITSTYRYDVFGAARGSATSSFGFTGQQGDSSGLTYLRARSYEPGSGRFTRRDPLRTSPMSLSPLYAYPLNATRLIDPLGLCGWSDVWGCTNEITGTISQGVGNAAQSVGDFWNRNKDTIVDATVVGLDVVSTASAGVAPFLVVAGTGVGCAGGTVFLGIGAVPGCVGGFVVGSEAAAFFGGVSTVAGALSNTVKQASGRDSSGLMNLGLVPGNPWNSVAQFPLSVSNLMSDLQRALHPPKRW